ncbi:hypothetical protein J7T55_014314 [Diaporthe amygdali]|uniref:uncharacterized protein n=1 Tax=Phomopsis amygdali TaxID=1214568 RepID=UPI0022FDEC70|nr:uncharacterized protein J7T55_014314 [Diaporthe amygdali]KAJ0117864.1 hypothetical protein J7T55_014314 [Diaporthe amygdali]
MDPIDGHEFEIIDIDDQPDQWALMALDPSGKRQLFVREVGSGYQSMANLFREHGGDKLSVHKVNNIAHSEEKMKRPDREVSVARVLAASKGASHFAKLLSSQDLLDERRESWWEFYNTGSLSTLNLFMFTEVKPPLSLVFRIIRQCLEGIQCLNKLGITHMDLHSGNVFLHLVNGKHLNAVIGDFGYSRLPGQGHPAFTNWESTLMNTSDRKGESSPPGTYGPPNEFEDRSWRLRWDLSKFLFNIREDVKDSLDKNEKENRLLFTLFDRMDDMCKRDEQDRKLPEAERPKIQDLAQTIHDVKTLERLYAETDSDKEALSELLELLQGVLNAERVQPLVFSDEREARDKFQSNLDSGPFRMVNLSDENSIEAATAWLAALRIEGSAYVSGISDQSGSRPTSPASSETRDSTPAEDAEQQGNPTQQQAHLRQDVEKQTSPSGSHVTTRWSPATQGLAEATAFAGGDDSVVPAVLGARDVAERNQALVREEHHRRRRQQWFFGR